MKVINWVYRDFNGITLLEFPVNYVVVVAYSRYGPHNKSHLWSHFPYLQEIDKFFSAAGKSTILDDSCVAMTQNFVRSNIDGRDETLTILPGIAVPVCLHMISPAWRLNIQNALAICTGMPP